MGNQWFRFKQFKINQDRSAFKVGTDGVLLGAWVDTRETETVLDIGTGTGLLALMIAQRSVAHITGIEIDGPSFEQAIENVSGCPWPERIRLIRCSLQEYSPDQRFDMVLANPPFFQDSLPPQSEGLGRSKHNISLKLNDLASFVPALLAGEGRFCVILPPEEGRRLGNMLEAHGIHLYRSLSVRPTPLHRVKRRLLDFRFFKDDRPADREISIEAGGRHRYTEEYIELTKEFYLDF